MLGELAQVVLDKGGQGELGITAICRMFPCPFGGLGFQFLLSFGLALPQCIFDMNFYQSIQAPANKGVYRY